jgi:hypothetical protein
MYHAIAPRQPGARPEIDAQASPGASQARSRESKFPANYCLPANGPPILGGEMHPVSNAVELTFADQSFRTGSFMPLKEQKFDTRRSGVQDKDGITHDVALWHIL